MSWCSQVKELLAQKTRASLTGPKKQRPDKCCAAAFEAGRSAFGERSGARLERSACRGCLGMYLRGAFLAAGSLTDPNKSYHLEIPIPDEGAYEDLGYCLEQTGFPFKTVRRGAKRVFYLKDSDMIEDFLTTVGCQEKAVELMQLKVEKDVKNRINRINNYDGANLQRTVDSSGKVREAIALLKSRDMYERLPDSVKKAAALRGRYPSASLSELCSLSDESITKSGLNHRLQRIIEEAEKLKDAGER